ncbi:Wzy polymerase domain-containing protein [uncultured Halovibrio sp.]|uniref:PglL family O-oligosaccharyltransferase n=1 Tax=uncultured Halovibrio sp. TaxID=985049 RepID=UPI0025D8DB17|nr:Wzy polymerase domain-containing protein [uncultured Halovibrio sp.]
MGKIERALLVALFLVPTLSLGRFWPLSSALPNGLTLLTGALLLVASLVAAGRREKLPFSHAVLLPVLIAISLFISQLFVDAAIVVSFRWAMVTLLVSAAVIVGGSSVYFDCGREYMVWLLCRGLVVGGILYAVIALLLHYGAIGAISGVFSPDAGRLEGPWGQPNLTTSTLWLALFAGVYLACRNEQRFGGLLAFSVFIGWVMALAASRLNYLFIPLALGLALYAVLQKEAPIVRQGKQLGGVALVVCLCLLVVPVVSAPLEMQLADAGWIKSPSGVSLAEREIADQPRLIEHAKILNALPALSAGEWLVGSGFGQYGVFSFEQAVTPLGQAGGQGAWTHSHNLFSMVFIEMGLVGLLVTVGLVALLLRQLWRSRSEDWCVPVAGVMGTIFLHSMVEYPLWYPWYLVVSLLFVLPLFKVSSISVTSRWLQYATATLFLAVTLVSAWNLGSQTVSITSIAAKQEISREDYRQMTLLANDSFLGPYAILAKYRRFSPEARNLEWQLKEARRMAGWRPLDVVKVREATLLMMLGNMDEACAIIEETAAHYPASAPILIEKAVRIERINMPEIARFADCAERGLKVWGEDLESMRRKNERRIQSMQAD